MSEPTFKPIGNKYLFKWEEEKLEAEVARLHLHQDGRLTCNLTFRTFHPQYEPHLLKTSFNLSSSRSRAEVKKHLAIRYHEKVNWDAILEVLCLTTEAKFEEGEPVQELWVDDSDIPAPEYLINPILLKGVPTLIFGEKGAHKSTLALFLMACLTLPWRDNPLGLGVPDHPIPTLLLDWEQEWGIVRYYAKRIRDAAGLAAFPLLYRHCALPLTRDFDKIQSYIDQHNIEVIIIDSVGAACGGKLKDPDPALEFFTALRALKVTSLLLGQQSKDPEAKKSTPFGCYSEDTEVLTKQGWKKHSEISLEDEIACFELPQYGASYNPCLRWEHPQHKWEYNYTGEMFHIKHLATDALVTPNHRLLTRRCAKRRRGLVGRPKIRTPYCFREAQDMPNTAFHLPCSAPLKAKGKHHGRPLKQFRLAPNTKELNLPTFLQFLGYWISEGYLCKVQKGKVGLTQTEGEVLDKMKKCLRELGFVFTEQKSKRKVGWKLCSQLILAADAGQRNSLFTHTIRSRARGKRFGQEHLLANWLRVNCGTSSYDKHLPSFVWSLSRKAQQVLLDALIEGDGSRYASGCIGYWTASPQLADDVQRLAILIGHHATVNSRLRGDNPVRQYSVIINPQSRREITLSRSRHFGIEHYEGKVYCLTVPSGAYVTRRNGKMAILGNSTYFQYYSRAIYELRKSKDSTDDEAILALFHQEGSNYTRHQPPLGFSMNYNGTGISIQPQTLDLGEFIEKVKSQQLILDALKQGALSFSQILDTTGLPENTVRTTLTRLKKRNRVMNLERGLWGLVYKE